MKVISSVQGVCALRISPDDAATENGVLVQDVAEYIAEHYNFQNKPAPAVLANATLLQEYGFSGGRMTIDKQDYAIGTLNYAYGGFAVSAKNTDIAAMIADHIARNLDAKFGYKIANSIRDRYYLSDIVVEFDEAAGSHVNALNRIQELLEREIPRANLPFSLKRLSFGASEVNAQPIASPLDSFLTQDFTLERRAGEPYSSNRYFSRAPARTRDHERLLARIEESLRD
jgi:hypothetical protein